MSPAHVHAANDLALGILTLNFSVSFSELSEIAFARQIGTVVALSSADSELFGLPERTNACVPGEIGDGALNNDDDSCWCEELT